MTTESRQQPTPLEQVRSLDTAALAAVGRVMLDATDKPILEQKLRAAELEAQQLKESLARVLESSKRELEQSQADLAESRRQTAQALELGKLNNQAARQLHAQLAEKDQLIATLARKGAVLARVLCDGPITRPEPMHPEWAQDALRALGDWTGPDAMLDPQPNEPKPQSIPLPRHRDDCRCAQCMRARPCAICTKPLGDSLVNVGNGLWAHPECDSNWSRRSG